MAAPELPPGDVEGARELPPGLWDRLRADPSRAPEIIALAASERHAPAAAAWAADKRAFYGDDPARLAAMAKQAHARLARVTGAATGVGGVVTLLPDLVLAAWIQSRLVFFVAAAFGLDPHDRMRPAELLVLQELYPDAVSARAALDGVGTSLAEAYLGSKLSSERERTLTSTLLRMVGRRAAKRVAGRLIPGLAIAANAVGNERETRALADRAIAYYGGERRA